MIARRALFVAPLAAAVHHRAAGSHGQMLRRNRQQLRVLRTMAQYNPLRVRKLHRLRLRLWAPTIGPYCREPRGRTLRGSAAPPRGGLRFNPALRRQSLR